jgi:NADH:ubiquinone oxidoreductase subunit
MGILARIFTWWNGATIGTSVFSRRFGREAGHDEFGNLYFQHKGNPARRWVIYAGANDGSRVPPGWQAWLRGTIVELPDKAMPRRRSFEKASVPNLTGTALAYRPGGALDSGARRAAATGDYQAWKPD